MRIIKMWDDKDFVERASESLFDCEGDEFSVQYIEGQNKKIEEKCDKLGTLGLKCRKEGWKIVCALLACNILNNLIGSFILAKFSSAFLSIILLGIALIIKAGLYISIIAVAIFWFAYWSAPLKHCTFCNGLFSREIVFEEKVPGIDVETTDTRTVSKVIKDNKGEKIGTIDENIVVNVRRMGFYTVFRCKKCGKLKAEVIIKEMDL